VILDTNALSAFVDGESGVGDVLRRHARAAIPVIVLAIQHRLPVLSRDQHFDAVPDLDRESW